MLIPLRAEALFQLRVMRRTPDRMLPLVTVPLFTAAFLAITQNAGRSDLAGPAVIGAGLIGIWSFAIYISGDIIDGERKLGTLEGLLATPSSFVITLLGRIGTVTAVSFIGLVEAAVVAEAFFGVRLTIHHALLFVIGLACTWFAMTGTALIMSSLFVLTREVATYQNALTYPFYVLSGAVTPIALLPGWLHPISDAVFLSWSANLLRACTAPNPVSAAPTEILMILALGAVGAALGLWTTTAVLRRMRRLGTIGHV